MTEAAAELDVSCHAPLTIGFGPQSHFRGKIREARLYNRALDNEAVETLHRLNRPGD